MSGQGAKPLMTLLLLSGTGTATEIAARLARSGHDALCSVAGGARLGRTVDLPQREGGFGGEAGFRAFVKERGIRAVLDATHPFASRISERSARLCAEMGLPYCLVWRPEWVPEPGDRWIFLDQPEEAAGHVPPAAVVFLATGRAGLERFSVLRGRYLYCRQIQPKEGGFPLPDGEFILGTPPFTVEEEAALFRALRVDVLVVRNAGGEGSRSKLLAARQLGLLVLMLNRPPPPDAPLVGSVEAALDWVAQL